MEKIKSVVGGRKDKNMTMTLSKDDIDDEDDNGATDDGDYEENNMDEENEEFNQNIEEYQNERLSIH